MGFQACLRMNIHTYIDPYVHILVSIPKFACVCGGQKTLAVVPQTLTIESKADTRLLMSSSLRAKLEFQRSDPQPLVGMSQCFPSKAMVT